MSLGSVRFTVCRQPEDRSSPCARGPLSGLLQGTIHDGETSDTSSLSQAPVMTYTDL